MKPLSILIVEDDLSFALEIEILVRELGHEVMARVDNDIDALLWMTTYTPDLVLMDVDINGELTGIQVAEETKGLKIPVLFMTSYGVDEYYEQARETNFLGYLEKPIHKFALRSTIDLVERVKIL